MLPPADGNAVSRWGASGRAKLLGTVPLGCVVGGRERQGGLLVEGSETEDCGDFTLVSGGGSCSNTLDKQSSTGTDTGISGLVMEGGNHHSVPLWVFLEGAEG